MTKKTMIGLALVGLLFVGSWALAANDDPGRPQGAGYGRCGGGFAGPGQALDQDSAKMIGQIYQKNLEIRALLNESKVDDGKVNALQAEINKLQGELAQKQLAAALEYKKKNPDWQPGAGQGCPMRGQGGYGSWGCQRQ